MSSKNALSHFHQSFLSHNLGMRMENLVVIRWLSFPLQSLTALLLLAGKSLWIFNADPSDIFTEEMFWVVLVLGVIYLLIGFSTLFRFIQLFLSLWKFGKASQDVVFRKTSLYQLIRMMLSGLIIILGIIIGLLVLLPSLQPAPTFFEHGMSYRYYPEYNFALIIVLGLVMGVFWFLMKILHILSMLSLDEWAHLQKNHFSSAEDWQILTSGTNLMKYSVFVQLVSPFFGYLLFNLGLSKTGKSFKRYLPHGEDPNEQSENQGKKEQSIKKHSTRVSDRFQRASTSELQVFCSHCGYRMRET